MKEVNLPETGGALPGLQRRRSQLISGSLPEVKKEFFISYRSFDTNAVDKKIASPNADQDLQRREKMECENGLKIIQLNAMHAHISNQIYNNSIDGSFSLCTGTSPSHFKSHAEHYLSGFF